jgi:hypothetical protein
MQVTLSGGRNRGGWIPVHNDIFYIIDSNEKVKMPIMGLVLRSTGVILDGRGGVGLHRQGQTVALTVIRDDKSYLRDSSTKMFPRRRRRRLAPLR